MGDLFDAATGALGGVYRSVDWAATPLGPVETWSPTLRWAVDLMLHTRAAVTLIWGDDRVLLYNDAYVPMIGDKHPAALGAPTREVFAEIWDEIGPMLDHVHGGKGSTWVEDHQLLIDRRGFLEETYFTFSYSPVRGPDGRIEGVIDIAGETTAQVVDRRRLQLLARLTDRLVEVDQPEQLPGIALPLLRSAPEDLPDVDIVLSGDDARLAGRRELVLDEEDGSRTAIIRLAPGDDARLVTRLSPHLPFDAQYRGFLRLIGSTLTQAMNRIRVRQAEQRVARVEREMSEALQRSLLTPPMRPENIEVAVRYLPATEHARVGGDWYDAFALPDGALAVVVGDVSGHDQLAAAAMAQTRNLLRGIAYTVTDGPAGVLTRLDEAIAGLAVGVVATVVLARLEPTVEPVDAGRRTLTWSNAGHPPPVLREPGGGTRLLSHRSEPLLGTRFEPVRTDHAVELAPGSYVVLYTDGLVERRGVPLDDSLARLVDAVAAHPDAGAERLCDHLLATFGGAADDDVALAVLRVGRAG